MTIAPPAAALALPSPSRPRRVTAAICFTLPALAMLAFGGQLLVTGWTTDRAGGTHHVQDLAWGALEGGLLLVPLCAALMHRGSRSSAVLQALAVVVALVVTMLLVAQPDPFTGGLAALVCAGAAAYGTVRGSWRPDPAQLSLAAVAAVPLLIWATRAAAEQRRDADEHAELVGYAGVTAFALALLAVLIVASLRRPGWRTTSITASAGAAIVGVAGLLWPGDASSPGVVGGIGLLALAVGNATLSLRTAGRRT